MKKRFNLSQHGLGPLPQIDFLEADEFAARLLAGQLRMTSVGTENATPWTSKAMSSTPRICPRHYGQPPRLRSLRGPAPRREPKPRSVGAEPELRDMTHE